jgi:hypothetical protein
METPSMTDQTLSLGERILLATRLCVEEHLRQQVTEEMKSERQVTIGGAGLDSVTDDSLPIARGHAIFAWSAEGEAA